MKVINTCTCCLMIYVCDDAVMVPGMMIQMKMKMMMMMRMTMTMMMMMTTMILSSHPPAMNAP